MDVQMTDEELMDKAVDALVNAFIVMFRSAGYPVRPLYYSEGGITLEIRVPPTLPDFIMKKYPRFRDGFRACPSIELIGIPYEWQGCGFFTKLVNALGAEPSVECVCISCVTNEVFSQKLQNNPEWELLYYSELFDVKGFYKVFKRD